MKKGWQTKTLEEVCQFSNGLWKGEKPPFVNVGVIRNTNFTKEGMLDDSDIAYLDVEAKKLDKRRLQFGDIILEKSGGGPKQPVGRVALFDKEDGDFSFSNFTAALRVRDAAQLDFRFLHKFLHWEYLSGITEGMQSHSTGIRNLDGNAYKAIEISFPPIPEQKRIVGILDEAFDAVAIAKANTEKKLQNTRALVESYTESVFSRRGRTWHKRPLESLCSLFVDSAHRTPRYQEDGIPALRPRDVVNGELNLSNAARVSENEYEIQAKRHKPASGDIVYSRELSYGWAALLPESPRVCLSQGMCLFRPSQQLDSAFLIHVLNGSVGREQAMRAAVGAAHPHINLSDIRAYLIPSPPVTLQKQIAAEFDALKAESKRLEFICKRKSAVLEELKKSMLCQAFSGTL
jgi:type I restriction enzyme S subunit